MIKAIIFDVGGVLRRTIDQKPRIHLAKEFDLSNREINDLVFGSDDYPDPQIGLIGWEEHFSNICERLNIDREEGADFIDRFFAGDQLNMELIDFIIEFRNKFKMAILSNAMTNLEDLLENEWQIRSYFDVIVNSSRFGSEKPNESIYLHTIDCLGIKTNEAIFIDDKLDNVIAANELGIHGIHFSNNNQTLAELNELVKEE